MIKIRVDDFDEVNFAEGDRIELTISGVVSKIGRDLVEIEPLTITSTLSPPPEEEEEEIKTPTAEDLGEKPKPKKAKLATPLADEEFEEMPEEETKRKKK